MSVVEGVSFAHTGIVATSFTTCVTTEMSSSSLPMFEPMSAPVHVGAREVQLQRVRALVLARLRERLPVAISSSVPEPAMIDAIRSSRGRPS